MRKLASVLVLTLIPVSALASEAAAPDKMQIVADTIWVVFAGILVFFMNAGFGLLETGLCRAKNAVNILAKNFSVAAFAGLAFFVVGFAMMFGDGSGWLGTSGFLLADEGAFSSLDWTIIPLEAKFFFQVCFVMTAASIVSGAVAERIKFRAFILFSVLLAAVIYPVTGHWIWGGGWLAEMGFWDFAGSTQVHSVGGWAALIGVLILGPRLGKYRKDGKIRPIQGHNMALATAGGFVLWLGWFGFNAGSTMAADATAIGHIATTTMLASLAGVVGAIIMSYGRSKTFDLTMIINGSLAGLVGITAGCAFVSTGSSILIGMAAGMIVVPAVGLLDRLKVDDPVGAISVHLICGIWGTLAVGLFADAAFSADVGNGLLFGGGAELLVNQLIGVAVVGVFVSAASAVLWLGVKATVGLRVSEEEEHMGLDRSEMGLTAYPQEFGGVPQTEAIDPVAVAAGSPVPQPEESAG